MIHDRARTLLLPVTLPEDLPVLETRELVERARSDIGIGVDRIVVNRMPTGRAGTAVRNLERIPSELELECLPTVMQMRSMLEHSSKRDRLAVAQRVRVSNLCKLPVIGPKIRMPPDTLYLMRNAVGSVLTSSTSSVAAKVVLGGKLKPVPLRRHVLLDMPVSNRSTG